MLHFQSINNSLHDSLSRDAKNYYISLKSAEDNPSVLSIVTRVPFETNTSKGTLVTIDKTEGLSSALLREITLKALIESVLHFQSINNSLKVFS